MPPGAAATSFVFLPLVVNSYSGTGSTPTANFIAAPLSGTVPLTVTFTDLSMGTVDSRLWDFGDGITLTVTTLTTTHTYTASGVYTVSLTASGPGGSGTLTRPNYITARSGDTTPPTISDFGPWGFITETLPTFQATISDGLGVGVEAGSIIMTLDGQAVSFDYDAVSGVISYTPSVPLTETLHTVALEAGDRAGNRTGPVTWAVWVNVSATVGMVNPAEAYRLAPSGDPMTVTVDFPAGAVTQTVSVMYGRLTDDWDLAQSDFEPFFELRAMLPDGSEGVSFCVPLTVTVGYTEDQVDGLSELLSLAYLNEDSGQWEEIPGRVDWENRLIVAQVSHFSRFTVKDEAASVVLPTLKAFETSLFSGAASFSYDLEVPVGAGGLAPRLTLNYSSARVNRMGDDADNSDGGWLGVGWDLDLGEIAFIHNKFTPDNRKAYSINLNGISEKLIRGEEGPPSGGYRTIYHYTEHESFMRIVAHLEDWDDGRKGWWELWDREGNHYYFQSDLFYYKRPHDCLNRQYTKWKLTRVVDVHGNVMEISYVKYEHPENRKPNGPWCEVLDKESYPSVIRYTTNPAGDGQAEYTIYFDISKKARDAHPKAWVSDSAYKLDAVRMYYNGQLIRQYRFHYTEGEYDGHPYCLLTRIEQLGADGGKTLPDMTFSYETHDILRREHKSDGRNSDKIRRRHFLQQANNGYGGWVRYTYRSWMPADTNKTFMQRWLVNTRQFGDVTSGYAPPAYRYSFSEAREKGTGQNKIRRYEFVGYGQATVTDPLGNVERHWFHTDDARTGRESELRREGPGGVLYEQTLSEYQYREYNRYDGLKNYFPYLARREVLTWDGDSQNPRPSKTLYHYDDYGNLAQVREYGEGNDL